MPSIYLSVLVSSDAGSSSRNTKATLVSTLVFQPGNQFFTRGAQTPSRFHIQNYHHAPWQ